MTQDIDHHDVQDSPDTSQSPPLSNHHFLLPLAGAKYAPRTLRLNQGKRELSHFLQVYSHLCVHYNIVQEQEKCFGILTYCTPKVVRMIEKLPSFNEGDFLQLIKDLYYFLEDDDDTYNISKVQTLTRRWRKRHIESLEKFKRYQRKYLDLVGKAKGSHNMTEEDYNRYFWEGIHRSLRKKIEDRMLVADPELDVSTPFEMAQVVKATGYIFNKHRFDQHLFNKTGHDSSETESEDEDDHPLKPSNSDSEEEKEEDSDDSDSPRKTSSKKKAEERKATLQKDALRKKEDGEISKLVHEMGRLKLTDPKYRTRYVEVIWKDPNLKDVLEKPKPRSAPDIPGPVDLPQRDLPPHQVLGTPPQPAYGPPHQAYRPPQGYGPPHQAYGPPPHQGYGPPPHQGYGPPPHQAYGPPSSSGFRPPQQSFPPSRPPFPSGQPPDRASYFCFGCGKTGHRTIQCGEINTLIHQGIVTRDSLGRIQWPDGSPIRKDREDTLLQAINKASKKTNIVRAEFSPEDYNDVHQYVGIAREDDDASSDEQEELGWTSGHIDDRYSLGAERSPRVSRETRKQVQFNPPGLTQGVKKLPERRDAVGVGRQRPPINQPTNLNSQQFGSPKRITPFDIHKGKFEGEKDDQLLPMEVDQGVVEEPRKEARKGTTHPGRGEVLKVTNPGPRAGRTSSEIIQDIMKMPLTISVEEAVHMSPTLRRDLTSASKATREALPQGLEKKEKTVFQSSVSQSLLQMQERRLLGEPRDDLLTVTARVG